METCISDNQLSLSLMCEIVSEALINAEKGMDLNSEHDTALFDLDPVRRLRPEEIGIHPQRFARKADTSSKPSDRGGTEKIKSNAS